MLPPPSSSDKSSSSSLSTPLLLLPLLLRLLLGKTVATCLAAIVGVETATAHRECGTALTTPADPDLAAADDDDCLAAAVFIPGSPPPARPPEPPVADSAGFVTAGVGGHGRGEP